MACVSKENAASVFKVKEIGEQETSAKTCVKQSLSMGRRVPFIVSRVHGVMSRKMEPSSENLRSCRRGYVGIGDTQLKTRLLTAYVSRNSLWGFTAPLEEYTLN
jgi:hypothetical protein